MVKYIFYLFLVLSLSFFLAINYYFNQKPLETSFSGISKLEPAFLEQLLKEQKFNFFYNNHKQIIKILESNPLVKDIKVNNCEIYSFKCYLIDIEEADILFSLITKDTNQIYVFSKNLIQLWTGSLGSTIPSFIKESRIPSIFVNQENLKYFLPQASLRHIKDIFLIIKTKNIGNFKIDLIDIDKFKLKIDGLDFPIIFSFKSDEIDLFKKEFIRFEKIMVKLKDKLSEIKAINLSFDRIGSVIMK